jgi:SAM-dependent methyltransferase
MDVAAGEGRNAIWLAAQGWDVTAVDFSLVGLDKGRSLQARHERGRDLHIDWVHADVLDYDPGDGAYDLALLAYLQLPAEQRRAAVRRSFLSLKDGGTLFVVAHDSTNLTEGTGGPQEPASLHRRGCPADPTANASRWSVPSAWPARCRRLRTRRSSCPAPPTRPGARHAPTS